MNSCCQQCLAQKPITANAWPKIQSQQTPGPNRCPTEVKKQCAFLHVNLVHRRQHHEKIPTFVSSSMNGKIKWGTLQTQSLSDAYHWKQNLTTENKIVPLKNTPLNKHTTRNTPHRKKNIPQKKQHIPQKKHIIPQKKQIIPQKKQIIPQTKTSSHGWPKTLTQDTDSRHWPRH